MGTTSRNSGTPRAASNRPQERARLATADAKAETVVMPAVTGAAVMLEVPVAPERPGYVTRGFGRDLASEHAAIVRRIGNQLRADGVRLASGREIERPEDVLAWVAERVARQLTAAPGKEATRDEPGRTDGLRQQQQPARDERADAGGDDGGGDGNGDGDGDGIVGLAVGPLADSSVT